MVLFWDGGQSKGPLRQYWAAITVNTGMLVGGEYFGWPSPTLPKLRQADAPFTMTHSDITWMVSLLYLGNILSPIPTGYCMDHFGRKKTLLYFSVFPISSWVITYYARSPLYLHVARLLGGLWIGTITTVAPMYSGEIAEPKIRGALGNIFSFMTYVGVLLVYAVGPYVSYYCLAVVSGIIPVCFLIMITLMPESPYYYLIHNDKNGARESLRWLRAGITDDQLETEVNAMNQTVLKQRNNSTSLIKAIINSKADRRAFLIVQLYAIFVKFSGIGIIMAFNSITLPKSAFVSIRHSECAIILASVWVVSSTLSIVLVDRLGRKVLLTGTSLACCLTMFLVGLWFYMDEETMINVDHLNWVPFVSFIFHGIVYCMGLGPVGTAIKGEMLSADIRASASAVTTIVFALASLFLNQTYLPFADNVGMYVNYWLYSANCLICAIFTALVFVETKGRTLEEIQDRLADQSTIKFNQKKCLKINNKTCNVKPNESYIITS